MGPLGRTRKKSINAYLNDKWAGVFMGCLIGGKIRSVADRNMG